MSSRPEIKFSIDKKKALRVAKKTASAKFAIMKDNGDTFSVGAPGMTATIEVGNGIIKVSGKDTIVNTVYNDLCFAFEDIEEEANKANSQPSHSADDELKIVEAIRQFKELLDDGIITEEEFEAKKKELLSDAHPASNNTNNANQSGGTSNDESSEKPSEVAGDKEPELTPEQIAEKEEKEQQKKEAAEKQTKFAKKFKPLSIVIQSLGFVLAVATIVISATILVCMEQEIGNFTEEGIVKTGVVLYFAAMFVAAFIAFLVLTLLPLKKPLIKMIFTIVSLAGGGFLLLISVIMLISRLVELLTNFAPYL